MYSMLRKLCSIWGFLCFNANNFNWGVNLIRVEDLNLNRRRKNRKIKNKGFGTKKIKRIRRTITIKKIIIRVRRIVKARVIVKKTIWSRVRN